MRFSNTIVIPEWNESIWRQIMAYWEAKEIVFTETSGDTLLGQRGDIWGNLLSFNPRRLITSLHLSRIDNRLVCVLDVNTQFQLVPQRDQAKLQAEVDGLADVLLKGRHLLRPSQATASSDELLRAAAEGGATPAEEMLRGSDHPEEVSLQD